MSRRTRSRNASSSRCDALKVRAERPNNVAVLITVGWNSWRDFTGAGVYTDDWGPSDYATVRFTMRKSNYQVSGRQSATVGYGCTEARRPPLSTLSCP
ncbi:hypothetical protein [Saccharothrix stipae]